MEEVDPAVDMEEVAVEITGEVAIMEAVPADTVEVVPVDMEVEVVPVDTEVEVVKCHLISHHQHRQRHSHLQLKETLETIQILILLKIGILQVAGVVVVVVAVETVAVMIPVRATLKTNDMNEEIDHTKWSIELTTLLLRCL